MTEPLSPNGQPDEPVPEPGPDLNTITPLEGELGIPSVTQHSTRRLSWKGLSAISLAVLTVFGVLLVVLQHSIAKGHPGEAEKLPRAAERPSAAVAPPRQLDMTPAPKPVEAPTPRIPNISPLASDGPVEPIGVRRTGNSKTGSAGNSGPSPEDAPVLLVASRPVAATATLAQAAPGAGQRTTTAAQNPPASGDDPLDATRRNLDGYQRQLQGLLDALNQTTQTAVGGSTSLSGTSGTLPAANMANALVQAAGNGGTGGAGGAGGGGSSLFGGQLQGSATPRVLARQLGDRNLTLPKGTAFTCALKTKIISAASGFVGCQVQRNVYGDNGKVLLIERGSHLDGEYRIGVVRPGTVRIPVLWTRLRTPLGVTVDLDSPGTGPLGESGIDGYVDNRWGERLGAAMLLSLIDDSVKLVIQQQSNQDNSGNSTVILPSTTSNTSKLAEKVLDSTINIPPLIYQHQGGIVGIYVARDVDFSSVYALQPVAR
jgi:type IV secretion system protein VirB10